MSYPIYSDFKLTYKNNSKELEFTYESGSKDEKGEICICSLIEDSGTVNIKDDVSIRKDLWNADVTYEIKFPKYHFLRYLCSKVSNIIKSKKIQDAVSLIYINIDDIKTIITKGYDLVFLNTMMQELKLNVVFFFSEGDYYIKTLFIENNYGHPYASNYLGSHNINHLITKIIKEDEEVKILNNIRNNNQSSKFHIVNHTIGGILGENYVLVRYGPEFNNKTGSIGRYYFFVDNGEPLMRERDMMSSTIENIPKELTTFMEHLGRWTIDVETLNKVNYTKFVLNHTALKLLELEKLSLSGKKAVTGVDNDVINTTNTLRYLQNCSNDIIIPVLTEYRKINKMDDVYPIYGFATANSLGNPELYYYNYTYLRFLHKINKNELISYTQFNEAEPKKNIGKIVYGYVGQFGNSYLNKEETRRYASSNNIHLWTGNFRHVVDLFENSSTDIIGGGQASSFKKHLPGSMPLCIGHSCASDAQYAELPVKYLFQVYPINYYSELTEHDSYNYCTVATSKKPIKKSKIEVSDYKLVTVPIFKLEDITLNIS